MLVDILNMRVTLKQYQIIQKDLWNSVWVWRCLCCHGIISAESDIIGKLVGFLFQRCPVREDPVTVGWTVQLRSGWGPKENGPNFPPIGKQFSLFLLSVLTLPFCVVWGIVWFNSATNKEQTTHVGLFTFNLLNKIRSLTTTFEGSSIWRWCCDSLQIMLQLAFGGTPASTCPTAGALARLDKGGVLGTDTKWPSLQRAEPIRPKWKTRDAPDTLQSGLVRSNPGDLQWGAN